MERWITSKIGRKIRLIKRETAIFAAVDNPRFFCGRKSGYFVEKCINILDAKKRERRNYAKIVNIYTK